jgi:hypothetical protein
MRIVGLHILAGNWKFVLRYHVIGSQLLKSDLEFLQTLGWQINLVEIWRAAWPLHLEVFVVRIYSILTNRVRKDEKQMTMDLWEDSSQMHSVKLVWLSCSDRCWTPTFCFSLAGFFPRRSPVSQLVRKLSDLGSFRLVYPLHAWQINDSLLLPSYNPKVLSRYTTENFSRFLFEKVVTKNISET